VSVLETGARIGAGLLGLLAVTGGILGGLMTFDLAQAFAACFVAALSYWVVFRWRREDAEPGAADA
jgi:positive regulator of sigma E activity